jgi:anti-anti-sigma factor
MFERVKQGAVDVVWGDLPLNVEYVGDLRAVLTGCLTGGQPHVVLDLSNMPLIDGAGLELLLDCKDEFEALGGALKLAGPNPLCREILAVTGVGSELEIFPEPLSAVGSFVR